MGLLNIKPIVFTKAGRITAIKYGSDGSLAWAPDKMSTVTGIVESISAVITTTDHKLPDGNSKLPAGSYETDIAGKVDLVLNSYSADMFALLAGATVANTVNENMVENGDEMTIPAASPFATILKHVPAGNFVLVGSDNSPFTKVAAAPAVGQVSVSGASCTYNSVDGGKEVLAIYEWSAPTAAKWSLAESSNRPIVQLIVTGEATDDDQLRVFDTNFVVDRCKAVGDLNPPQQQKTPQTLKLGFEIVKPRAGKQIVDWKASPRP